MRSVSLGTRKSVCSSWPHRSSCCSSWRLIVRSDFERTGKLVRVSNARSGENQHPPWRPRSFCRENTAPLGQGHHLGKSSSFAVNTCACDSDVLEGNTLSCCIWRLSAFSEWVPSSIRTLRTCSLSSSPWKGFCWADLLISNSFFLPVPSIFQQFVGSFCVHFPFLCTATFICIISFLLLSSQQWDKCVSLLHCIGFQVARMVFEINSVGLSTDIIIFI